MTKGITGKEPDPREVYRDIIDRPRPQSWKHPPMSLYDRAAQFAPFAALSGYDEMIGEEARLTDRQIEPGEDQLALLNEAFLRLDEALAAGRKPVCEITWFVPDARKQGGTYVTSPEEIRRVDLAARKLILSRTEGSGGSYVTIDLDRILQLIPADSEAVNRE